MAKCKLSNGEQLELINFLGELSNDPVKFVLGAFPWGEPGELEDKAPDPWQMELLADIRDGLKTPNQVIREAVASGHGIGKSTLVAWIILWAISTYEDTRGVVTANTDSQLKEKTWAELEKWYRLFIAKDLFTYTATAIFSIQPGHEKTWRISAIPWSDTNPEAFAGLHNQGKRILLIFDEASAISDKIWEVAEGALTDVDTQIIWCAFGNPTRNNGRFFDCFHRERKLWRCRQIDSRTVAISNKQQIQEWLDTKGGEDSDFFKVRVKGQFPSASDKQFISTSLVDDAQRRNLHPSQFNFAPVIIGVDPAWTGEDNFVIYLRQGLMCNRLGSYTYNDNDAQMAAIIANFEDQYQADAVNIDQGYGTGIASFGRAMGRSWLLVSFAGAPSKAGYLNKRAEMWGDVKEWLKNGGVLPQDQTIHDDLIAPEYEVNEKGLIKLESKKNIKKRGLASPNDADALALTFARPVLRRTRVAFDEQRKDYDPFDGI